MKIMIAYPPLMSEKGVPLLAQNRQFQWFKNPTYIYPMVPAFAATMLKAAGFDVSWEDGIAEGMSEATWKSRFHEIRPDVVVLESKTPVIRRHWNIVRDIKASYPSTIVVLIGDHVTARPEESMNACPADYIVTGGDYDFSLVDLCRALAGKSPPSSYPPGTWYRKDGNISTTGPFTVNHDLALLPRIDRELTKWTLYAYKNGNFKYTPGTYVMASRDCWWGRCRFCSWTTLYPAGTYRTVPVEKHLDEIGSLINNYGIREIFDDSGCFPKGEWLRTFCRGMIDRGYANRVILGCNMRIGGLNEEDCRLMKQAGFRFILIGLESVSQSTLDRLDKGVRVEDIAGMCRMAKRAGLEPHVTIMVGYPWETRKAAEATIAFARDLFRRGFIDTLQATIVVPYPGTPLYEEAQQEGWLSVTDWDDFDMKKSVWRSPVSPEDLQGFVRSLYGSALSPRFLIRKLTSVRNLDDVVYLFKAGRKLLAHLSDFARPPHAGANP
jgi:anaerobic magnesium-protoporphyrin IX monomethyl ester cyclase